MISLLLTDGHLPTREALRAGLGATACLEVVGEAGTGAEPARRTGPHHAHGGAARPEPARPRHLCAAAGAAAAVPPCACWRGPNSPTNTT
ncbi:hypothetical protein ACFQT0_09270 [Hymenobacter humi]|uniref:Uncharacterized protein n=1 Tax=Hymenobacter humi TaxID=1411620 RepID=A0ABW2U3D7_9BACT